MKLTIRKGMLLKFVKFLKWSKIAAKLAAVGTTITGALASLSGSAVTGIALSAAGATTYAATDLHSQGCEKTRHIPPGHVNKSVNTLRKSEIRKTKKPAGQPKTMQSNMPQAKHAPMRNATGSTLPLLKRKQ